MAIETTRPILYVALLMLAAACNDGPDDVIHVVDDFDQVDDMTIATADAVDWQSGIVFAITDPFEDPFFYDDPFDDGALYLSVSADAPLGDPDRAAQIAADAENMYFAPADCGTVERSGPELLYALSACTGPLGRHQIDSALHVTFSDANGDIGVDLDSNRLRIDNRDVQLTGHGSYRASGGAKTVRYNSVQQVMAGAFQVRGSFESLITWTAGSDCVNRNAIGQIDAGGLSWDVNVDDYERCAARCPSSGAVTLRNGGGTWLLTFDGSRKARLERPGGDSDDVDLDCER